jgi:hypothetical protein
VKGLRGGADDLDRQQGRSQISMELCSIIILLAVF